jgi:predicted transcriptional regulator
MKILFFSLLLPLFLFSSASNAALKLNVQPPEAQISEDNGGKLDGSAFTSKDLKGKIKVLFYVDPDEKDLNNHVSEALADEKFPLTKYGSIAIINMAATWLPNFAIAKSLKSKQKKYPDTLYVKDLKKVLVKKWDLSDDDSNVLLFDKDGNVLFNSYGKLTAGELKLLISLIRSNL